MTQPFMAEAPMAGLVAQGPLPAGMLRIHQGNQERYVWPVHLPGWLLLGWRVAGSGTAPAALADMPLHQIVTAAADAPDMDPDPTAALDGAQPAASRGKRRRRRKEEEPPTAAVKTAPAVIGITAEETNAASDLPAASESTDSRSGTELAASSAASDVATEPAAESGAVPAAAAPAAAEASTESEMPLSALPDDLFDDPLI